MVNKERHNVRVTFKIKLQIKTNKQYISQTEVVDN